MRPRTGGWRAKTEDNLQKQVLAQWFPRSLDPSGGFYQNYSEDWTRGAVNDKAMVYQSRLTWVAAQAALRYPAQAEVYQADARHGLDFLADQMSDKQDGGLYWGLDDKGVPVRGGEKHAYGVSFAIYAACGDYQATHDAKALDFAKRAYLVAGRARARRQERRLLRGLDAAGEADPAGNGCRPAQ